MRTKLLTPQSDDPNADSVKPPSQIGPRPIKPPSQSIDPKVDPRMCDQWFTPGRLLWEPGK